MLLLQNPGQTTKLPVNQWIHMNKNMAITLWMGARGVLMECEKKIDKYCI